MATIWINDPALHWTRDVFYDVVLFDAHCSEKGIFRKDHDSTEAWSPQLQQLCGSRQKRILKAAVALLKKDGITDLYSTCTYKRLENEDQLDRVAG